MKVIHDDDLSVLQKHTQAIAKKMSSFTSDKIIEEILRLMKNDEKIQELTYSGMMTFINTIGSHILCILFLFSCDIGRKWPDVDHSSREIFEEILKGLRMYVNMPEINANEYIGVHLDGGIAGGIKKIKVENIK